MPPRRNGSSSTTEAGTSQNRPKTVLCSCKLYCLTLNQNTGRYEGDGYWIPARTRSRHRRDERLHRLLQVPLPSHNRSEPVESEQGTSIWLDLIDVELDVLSQVPTTSPYEPLVFQNDPGTNGPYSFTWHPDNGDLPDAMIPNQGRHALKVAAPRNQDFLRVENSLWELYRVLKTFALENASDCRCTELLDKAVESLQHLEREKEMHWTTQRTATSSSELIVYNNEGYFKLVKPMHKTVKAAALVCLVLQNIHFTSRRALQTHLGGLRDLLKTVELDQRIIDQIPLDPRTLTSKFTLDPNTRTYVVCPTCHRLYFHYATSGSKRHFVNDTCRSMKTPTSQPCNTALWETTSRGPRGEVSFPKKKFVYQTLKSWIGRMLSRPGVEELMETRPVSYEEPDAKTEIDDIWQSAVFSLLKDRSNQRYYPGPPDELRLVFSLSVDGFDPFGNKAGKQASGSTGIWMVLLNLPRHLRYLHENVYVAGVIPGPSKPSNEKINHYIQLTVDELKELWHPGVFYSRTFKFPRGRTVRSMLIPLVCDLLAARQVIGYPGTTTAHYCCTACDIDKDDINVTDPREWPQKDVHHIRKFAQLWRDAQSEDDQDQIFRGMGWRWSPLLELEYWDPSIFTVIDSMHSLDLNLLHHHCRYLFGIDIENPGGEAIRPASKANIVRRVYADRGQLASLQSCQELIHQNDPELLYELVKFHRKVLYSFCLDYDIRAPGNEIVIGTRWVLAKNIALWRRTSSPSLTAFLNRYPQFSEVQESLRSNPDSPDLLQDDDDDGRLEEATEQEKNLVEVDVGDEELSDGGQASDDAMELDGNVAEEPEKKAKGPTARVLASLCRRLVTVSETSVDSKQLYQQCTVKLLTHFLDLLGVAYSDIGTSKRKLLLYNRLLDNLTDHPELAQKLKDLFPVYHRSKGAAPKDTTALLGIDVMEQIWSDMKRTRLPSWITPAPEDWGTKRRGKLSADNWRVIACIHLPITLIRLFGRQDGRKRELLLNFLDLIMAVRIATMRRISLEQIQEYEAYIFRYTNDVKKLYPHYRILPAHHSALHIGDMLRRFGPKHSHDSPHYERYINFFHHMNTNNKLGELEGTFLRTSARNVNLQYLLNEDKEVTGLVRNLITRMKLNEKERMRGFRLIDLFAPREQDTDILEVDNVRSAGTEELCREDHELLSQALFGTESGGHVKVSPSVISLDALSVENSIYASFYSSQYRDSEICFHHNNERRAGVIVKVFKHKHTTNDRSSTGYYFIVQAFLSLDEEQDIYRGFGPSAGFSCKAGGERERILITPAQIISHVALTEIEELGIVSVLPVNREMLSLEVAKEDTGTPQRPAS